ncbi:hypothetical protein GGR54DRAFT_406592 [Hypoxylon sp. NC1633]|nr:hypothetical protein GGR54DRAFT_406592 [Hypoxylon sp. NC1633]
MASSAIAIPNGLPAPVQQQQEQQHQYNNNVINNADAADANNINNANTSSITIAESDINVAQPSIVGSGTSIKRKRDPNDVGEKPPKENANRNVNGITINRIGTPNITSSTPNAAVPSPTVATKVDQSTILNYFEVLQRLDPVPSVLKRPLPDPQDSLDEPQAKRKKSDDWSPPSIADKVAREQYEDVDSIIVDIKTSISDYLAELRDIKPGQDTESNDEAIAGIINFKREAYGIFKREMTYPNKASHSVALRDLESISDLQSNAGGNIVLTVNGEGMRGKQLYSSLQQPVPGPNGTEAVIRPLREIGLPSGIKTARAIPYSFTSNIEKDKKAKTLGELFPAPRNLPSLPPPKAPKGITKGLQVSWHRPELTEQSKYRAGSYFSQNISAGKWLDYSNAAPPSQIMTKQRERALSLAGNKPSSSDLEMSEMESLFRGAFSSFAPSRDDSAAMISSGLITHTMWWQKTGMRNFDRLIEMDVPEEEASEDADRGADVPAVEVDEDLIKEALDNWDEMMVDPSLEQVCCPKKPDENRDVEDILQEVSDMIQTLLSYQKKRNLTLPSPSSQSRYAADPAQSDMLTNGTPVEPDEEELATYQALKAQLALVIQMLPPYAVARLNSDKLDELNISTKIEVRTDEYQGLMEEDEAARAKTAQAAQAAATANPRPAPHRSSSSSNNLSYGQQYHPNRAPMPAQPYYGAQTPVRPPQPAIQRSAQSIQGGYPQRSPSNTGYRPPNHYPNSGYNQTFTAKPYVQPSHYGSTPTQSRSSFQPISGYPNMSNPTPTSRFQSFPQTTQAPTYHHQQYPAQPQQPHHASPTHPPPPYNQYTNGAGAQPQRTASPHIPHQPQHHQHLPIPAHQGYSPVATSSRLSSYSSQPNMGNDPSRRFYPTAGSPAVPNNQQLAHHSQHGQHNQHGHHGHHGQHGQQNQNSQTPGTSSFHTSLNPHQVQQAMDQAKARFVATKSAQRTTEGIRSSMSGQGQGQVGAPVGLGGIGLGGDPVRLAAARAGVPNYQGAGQSPTPQVSSPMVSTPLAVNGSSMMASTAPGANGGQSSNPQ